MQFCFSFRVFLEVTGADPGFFNGGWLIQSATKLFGIHVCISFFPVLDFFGGLFRRGEASHPIQPPGSAPEVITGLSSFESMLSSFSILAVHLTAYGLTRLKNKNFLTVASCDTITASSPRAPRSLTGVR